MGFDRDRFPGVVSDRLICSICKDVLEEPQALKKCGHIFCLKGCLSGITRDNGIFECPECRVKSEIFQQPEQTFFNFYNDLMMYCRWKDLGCPCKISITDEAKHGTLCEFNGFRERTCKDCGYKGAFFVDGKFHHCLIYAQQIIHQLKQEIQEKDSKNEELLTQLLEIKAKHEEDLKEIKTELDKISKERSEFFEKKVYYELMLERKLMIKPTAAQMRVLDLNLSYEEVRMIQTRRHEQQIQVPVPDSSSSPATMIQNGSGDGLSSQQP